MKIPVVLFSILSINQALYFTDSADETEWKNFKIRYNKDYASAQEDRVRKQIYMENKKKIVEHNRKITTGEVTYRMAFNEYGDLSHKEFLALMFGPHTEQESTEEMIDTDDYNTIDESILWKELEIKIKTYVPTGAQDLPRAVDWRDKGVVSPARKQGDCGSCWAFCATAAIESHYMLHGQNISTLSPQNLIDCAGNYGTFGCGGGSRDNAFRYIIANGGINSEMSYPYEEKDGICRYNTSDVEATLSGIVKLPMYDQQAMREVLANIGPAGAVMDASKETLQFYSSGIYHDSTCSSYNLNHDLLMIGYGTENGTDFWIMKNSWGTTWGEDGFFKISTANESCGVDNYLSFPVIDSGGKIALELMVIMNGFLFVTLLK